jgi:hypothetical protein
MTKKKIPETEKTEILDDEETFIAILGTMTAKGGKGGIPRCRIMLDAPIEVVERFGKRAGQIVTVTLVSIAEQEGDEEDGGPKLPFEGGETV